MILYPAIAACLRDEGLAADLNGPRPHGFGVRVVHNRKTYEFCIHTETGFLVHLRENGDTAASFDLADPGVWKKIKEYLECSSASAPSSTTSNQKG